MSRGRGRGAGRGSDREAWPTEGRGRSRHRATGPGREVSAWDGTGPPWDRPDWDDASGTLPPVRPDGPAAGHPSGPLPPLPPADSGPLSPLPPLPPERGRRGAPSGSGEGDSPGYRAGSGYRGDSSYPGDAGYPTGSRYADDAGYPTGPGFSGDAGYPGDAGHRTAGYTGDDYWSDTHAGDRYRGTGPQAYPGYQDDASGYRRGEYGDRDFPGDDYPDAGYADAGYADDGYPADADEYGYPDTGGYPGETRREYAEDGAYPDEAYRDDGNWYADDDPYDEEFLPGLDPGAERTRPPDGRRRTGPSRGRSSSHGGGRAPRKKRPMRRLAPWIALTVVLILVGGVGSVGYYYWTRYLHPADYSGSGTGSVMVHILPGETATEVGVHLQQLGVVESARAFGNAAKASPNGKSLEPGYYRLHKHMKASLAFALLLNPSSRVQTKVTIQEGLRVSQIITKLGTATKNLKGYEQAIKDVAALHLPPFANGKPEGYLYPATYDIQPGTPPIKVLQAMVTRFDQEAANIKLPAAAAHGEITQAQAIIVASLVEAEGRRVSDYPKIARVIYNRLNAVPSMKLQLDSTVMYALNTYGIIASTKQTQVKSPYNTYLHAGLPPGPIDCPGNAAIQAALHPAKGSWLYFVTVNPKTGLTKFTDSAAVFQQLRAQLQKNLGQG